MTSRPSIESLRDICMVNLCSEDEAAMNAALTELAAYREREPELIERAERAEGSLSQEIGRTEKLRTERDTLKQWYDQHEERETACCPEDVSCTEFIGYLQDSLSAAQARADALAARCEELTEAAAWMSAAAEFQADGLAREGYLRVVAPLLSSTPAASLEAHDAKVREPLEKWIKELGNGRPWLHCPECRGTWGSAETDALIARVRREALEDPELINRLVDRFLGWKLPEDFVPDCGISFKCEYNENTAHPMKHEPTGTNLFTAVQARRMFEYLLVPTT